MQITIPGKPIGKHRPRFARMGKYVKTYSDQETEEGLFFLQAQQQITKKFTGNVAVKISFHMPRPKSHYRTGKYAGVLKDNAPIYHTKVPDIDNLVKFAFDCLNKLAWNDDAQVSELSAIKVYSDEPRTEIQIMES